MYMYVHGSHLPRSMEEHMKGATLRIESTDYFEKNNKMWQPNGAV